MASEESAFQKRRRDVAEARLLLSEAYARVGRYPPGSADALQRLEGQIGVLKRQRVVEDRRSSLERLGLVAELQRQRVIELESSISALRTRMERQGKEFSEERKGLIKKILAAQEDLKVLREEGEKKAREAENWEAKLEEEVVTLQASVRRLLPRRD